MFLILKLKNERKKETIQFSQTMSSTFITILVTFVRHGQTDYNLKEFTQGQSNVPLNQKGIEQAILAGKSLSQNKFDLIYSSDLSRAYKTAETIVEKNEAVKEALQIVPEVLLRETSHGIYEHKPSSALKEAAEAAGFSEIDMRRFRPPEGENQDDVELRAREFVYKLIRAQCGKPKSANNILVVSHGLILREIFKILFEKDIGDMVSLEERKAVLLAGTGPNTGISKFKLTIEDINCDLISTKCISFYSDDHLNTSS